MLYNKLAKIPNYVKRFGLFSGLRLLSQVERKLPIKSQAQRHYDVPGYPAPIVLRESRPDHAIFWQCLVRDQYDADCFPQSRQLVNAYETMIRDGLTPTIIDCGANIGLASAWYAVRFPNAKIYAVEPDDDNFELLKKNTEAFGGRVTALKGAIWNKSGSLRIRNPHAGSAAFQVEESREAGDGSIQAYTIDEILAKAGDGSVPFIVKVDIEGAQDRLFAENTEWVGTTYLIALELDDWLMPWQGTSRPFFSCLSKYAFDYLMQGEAIFCFQDLYK